MVCHGIYTHSWDALGRLNKVTRDGDTWYSLTRILTASPVPIRLSLIRGIRKRSSANVDTLTGDDLLEKQEITVIDRLHPLYGRTFRVLSISSGDWDGRFVRVPDPRNHERFLRIPLTATNLVHREQGDTVKLTRDSITDLIQFSEEVGVCITHPKLSGNNSTPKCDNKSSTR